MPERVICYLLALIYYLLSISEMPHLIQQIRHLLNIIRTYYLIASQNVTARTHTIAGMATDQSCLDGRLAIRMVPAIQAWIMCHHPAPFDIMATAYQRPIGSNKNGAKAIGMVVMKLGAAWTDPSRHASPARFGIRLGNVGLAPNINETNQWQSSCEAVPGIANRVYVHIPIRGATRLNAKTVTINK